MKAGTKMDAFAESYEGDPLAAVREEVPPKDPEGEDGEEAEQSEDLNSEVNIEPDPDADPEIDQEAASAR